MLSNSITDLVSFNELFTEKDEEEFLGKKKKKMRLRSNPHYRERFRL